MLFASLQPIGQAFANGLPKETISVLERRELVSQLHHDANFKIFFKESLKTAVYFLGAYNDVVKDLKLNNNIIESYNLEKINNVDIFKDINLTPDLSAFNIENSAKAVFTNHPKLLSLSESDLIKVIEEYTSYITDEYLVCLKNFALATGIITLVAVVGALLVAALTATALTFNPIAATTSGLYLGLGYKDAGFIPEGTFWKMFQFSIATQAVGLGITYQKSIYSIISYMTSLAICLGYETITTKAQADSKVNEAYEHRNTDVVTP